MGDGFWDDTAGDNELEYFGIPGKGAWYRFKGKQEPFFVQGGVHALWRQMGYETGSLGAPTSNFDEERGLQTFEDGVIYWDGDSFMSRPSTSGVAPTVDSKPFDMPTPPPPPE